MRNQIVIKILKLYRYAISPSYQPKCRFIPTCSQYAIDAYTVHPFFKATLMVIKRLASCHPFGSFKVDEVSKPESHHE